jgi:hypothetical protein
MRRLEELANRSCYEWGVDNDVIWIKDLDRGGVSVTNNIDSIIAYLSSVIHIKEYMLMYCDSLGIWDEIRIDENHIITFNSINEKSYDSAIVMLRGRQKV